MKLLYLKALLISGWFSLIFLLVYGNGVGLHYTISPFLVLFSVIIILANYKKSSSKNSSVIKIFTGLIILSLLTSYHYFHHLEHRASYIEYISYSISGYIIALTTYVVVKKDFKMIDIIYYLTILFFIVGIFRFFKASTLIAHLHANTSYYYILMPLPLLLLKQKQYILHVLILITATILCILSVKRGAMLAIGMVWCVYIFNLFRESKKNFLSVFLLLFIVGSFISDKIEILDFVESTERLEERFLSLEEDGGSGRDDIISTFFKKDLKDLITFPDLFIGTGFEGTYYKYKDLSSMHNDFLEVLYSLGIIGLILLLRFYYLIFQRVRRLMKNKSKLLTPYLSMSLLFIFFSFIGCNFNYYHLSAPLFLSLGALEAIRFSNQQIKE